MCGLKLIRQYHICLGMGGITGIGHYNGSAPSSVRSGGESPSNRGLGGQDTPIKNPRNPYDSEGSPFKSYGKYLLISPYRSFSHPRCESRLPPINQRGGGSPFPNILNNGEWLQILHPPSIARNLCWEQQSSGIHDIHLCL